MATLTAVCAFGGPYKVGQTPDPVTVYFEGYGRDSDYDEDTGWQLVGTPGNIGLNMTADLVHPDATTEPLTFEMVRQHPVITFAGPLTSVGVYEIEFTATGTDAPHVSPLNFVAEQRDGWLTIDQARKDWGDAENADDVRLYRLLEASKTACIEYAPSLPTNDDGDVIVPLPAGYLDAQLLQLRNTWNAAKTDPSGIGDDGQMFVVRPYPLDNFIKQLLRPRRGVKVVG